MKRYNSTYKDLNHTIYYQNNLIILSEHLSVRHLRKGRFSSTR